MSYDDQLNAVEKRFLDDVLQHYNLLANEAKKKHLHIKEACETGIIRVRNASSVRIVAAMGLRVSLTEESQQILEPFFMGCDTKIPKMVQISINAMQKFIIFQCLNVPACQNLLICLWNLMENSIEEVKILQTLTLLITTNKLVINEQLAKAMSLCFRLHYTKNSTTNNTASATIRQLVTVIFERIQQEDKQSTGLTSKSGEHNKFDKMFDSISNSDSCRYKPINLSPFALDAFNFLQDLIQLINGELPFWLTASEHHQAVEITKTFGLELLELIIDQFDNVFRQHEEFTFILKEKVCRLIIKLFSPNIKQRGVPFSLLSPLLPKQLTSSGSANGSNTVTSGNSSNQSSGSTTSATASLQLSQSPYWPITVRLMRTVSVLIRNFFEILVTESEIFLSFLVKSLEVDKTNWQRSIALEALYRMIGPSFISSLCKYYDMKPQSSKILRDIINALCIYIQSQFQVVDSSTTTSLLTSLVNNTSGNPSQGFVSNSSNGNGSASHGSSKNSPFPTFNLRGISISLLFIPFHKTHKYKTFYIEQLEKVEPPNAREGHGLSTALACIFEIIFALTTIIEKDLGQSLEIPSENNNSKKRTLNIDLSKLSSEKRALHQNMLNSTFCGFNGTFSILLDASTDELIIDLILEQMQKLISLYGLYKLPLARDSLLISMCKSSLPGSYYQIPALNPYNLNFDSSFLPNSANDAVATSGSFSLNSLSQQSLSNAAINLPYLLSQQNVIPQTNLTNINPNNPTVPSNITSMENPSGTIGIHGDISRQIIAVGTPMPMALSGGSNSSSHTQSPVMLTSKNLQCMKSILTISNLHGYVYDEQTWYIVFTTLQHLVWILGLKPNGNGAFRLGTQQQKSQAHNSSPEIASRTSNSLSTPSHPTSVITNAAMSDLPVLTSMLSRLFECSQYLDDESLIKLIKALISLSNESLEVAFNNREPSLFALAKLLETSLVNRIRIDLFWDLIISHLTEVCSHPYNKLREWSVDVMCNLVKSVLSSPTLDELKKDNIGDTLVKSSVKNSQSYYLSALKSFSQIKYVDVRQKQIECCLQLLQSNGENFTDGWETLFEIIESSCEPQNENLVRCAFQCYQYVISDLLPHIPPINLIGCINTAVAFGSQMQELNVSLTAIGLIWNVADFLHTNQEKIQYSLNQLAKNENISKKPITEIFIQFGENLDPFQCLWISLFKNLSNLCTDARLSVRKSSGQTLFSTLSSHGLILEYIPWKTIFFYVLFPLIESVRTLCSAASNERITYSESSMNKPNSYGVDGNPEYIIHYSRNTAHKQWCETQVLVLNGVSRIICLKLDLFLRFSKSSSVELLSDNNAVLVNDENMLIHIWSKFFDFIHASALSPSSEVSISALKSFNEIVHYLNEYPKTNLETDVDESLQRSLYSIWKIIWKTWCNIGHNIGPNKFAVAPVMYPEVEQTNSGDDVSSNDTNSTNSSRPIPPVPAQVLQQLPSQTFLCLLIKPLFFIFPRIIHNFTDNDFKSLSFVLQNAIATPFLNEPSVYNFSSSDQVMTQLQTDVIIVLEKIQEQIMLNLHSSSQLLTLLFYQYLALSLYAVNIIPPHLNVFINSQFQHRFLPGELTSFNTTSFYIFGERVLKNAFTLYQSTYKETTVIKSHILHSLIKAYKIPLCFKYSCPLQSTWKFAVNYFIKTLELGLPLARKYQNEFMSIWADLALTFEGFLFPLNKSATIQTMEDQQMDESLDVKVVEVIRDNIMIYAQQIPKEFLLQIVSILNRGSIHSPSITSPIEPEGNRKLREDFARVCFQTLLQFSFFGPKGNPDLFIQSNKPTSPEHTIGIVNKLAVASILKRFNDVIVKYVEDEQLCPCPLPRHRLSEISFVLKALATLIISLKEAPPGTVEINVWKQLIELYPKIIDCTMSNSPQVNKSIREVLHEYAYLLKCPSYSVSSSDNSSVSTSTLADFNPTNGKTNSKFMKPIFKSSTKHSPSSTIPNGQNEV